MSRDAYTRCKRCGLKDYSYSCPVIKFGFCCSRHCVDPIICKAENCTNKRDREEDKLYCKEEHEKQCSPWYEAPSNNHPFLKCIKHCGERGHGHCTENYCASDTHNNSSQKCKQHCEEGEHGHCSKSWCDKDTDGEIMGFCSGHCEEKGHGHCARHGCTRIPEEGGKYCELCCTDGSHGHCVISYCEDKTHIGLCPENKCSKHCKIFDHNYQGKICSNCEIYPANSVCKNLCFVCCLRRGEGAWVDHAGIHCFGNERPCLKCERCNFFKENIKICIAGVIGGCASPPHPGSPYCLKHCECCEWHCFDYCEKTYEELCVPGMCREYCQTIGHGHCVADGCENPPEIGDDVFCVEHCDDRSHGHCAGYGCSKKGYENCDSCKEGRCRCVCTSAARRRD